jgi:hypothetical protein
MCLCVDNIKMDIRETDFAFILNYALQQAEWDFGQSYSVEFAKYI